jgi:hypothetical protein
MPHRHAPDVVSLVFGTLFAGFTVIWLLSAADVIDYRQAWLAGPAILIVAGILGLVVALRPSEPGPAPWAGVPHAGGGADADDVGAPAPVTEPTSEPERRPGSPEE